MADTLGQVPNQARADVAIITGAARNIGKGIARILLEQGATCVLLDKDEEALLETSRELSASSDALYPYTLDIADTEAIDNFTGWLDEQSLTVNSLVNNVGYEAQERLLNFNLAALRRSNQVNLEGPFYLTSLIGSDMAERGRGNILFITSTHTQVIRTHPYYSAAKAATEMFMREIALELAPHGVRVNAVAPGPVQDTPEPKPNDIVPLGYYQQPQDVAECAAFLLSDKARYITGQTLVVDGGFSITHTHHWLQNDRITHPGWEVPREPCVFDRDQYE